MCGITPNPLAEHENDDFCAEALLSLQSAKEQELDRFYCPFPGCKRSFAELWRLKVHFRAPPNVRGSGKERGHGMRLTHCPKCGTALKIGGHHVRCSAREAARQHMQLAKKPSRRNAAAASKAEQQAAPQQAELQDYMATEIAAAEHAQQQQHGQPAAPNSQHQPQSMVHQLMPQQQAAGTTAADGSSADNDDDTYTYAYQQQQWGDQSAWYMQQYEQQQAYDESYYQQQPQQQIGYDYSTANLADQMHLQRLQELLRRVDQHLGYDQEPIPAAQLPHYSSTSCFTYSTDRKSVV